MVIEKECEMPMLHHNSTISAVGAGSDSSTRWPAPGFLFGCGYPIDGWDVASEVRQGGRPVLGNKVNGFLKWTASFRRRRYRFARCGVVGRQTGYATQLRRCATEPGVRLPAFVSKGMALDSPGAVPEEAATKIRGLTAVIHHMASSNGDDEVGNDEGENANQFVSRRGDSGGR